MNATVQPGIATTVPRIRWGRIAIGAVLIEAVLIAGMWPMLTLLDNPLVTGTQGAASWRPRYIWRSGRTGVPPRAPTGARAAVITARGSRSHRRAADRSGQQQLR